MVDYLKHMYFDPTVGEFPQVAQGAPARTVTAAHTLGPTDAIVYFNAASSTASLAATLPDPVTCNQRIYNLVSIRGIVTIAVTGGTFVLSADLQISKIYDGDKLQVQSDGVNWRALSSLNLKPISRSIKIEEDFTVWVASTTPKAQAIIGGTGAGVTQFTPNVAGRPGIAQISTGTTATGRADVGSHLNSFSLGSGHCTQASAMQLPVLSNATQRYQCIVGLRDANTVINQVDGAYFLYDEGGVSTGSTASPNWQLVTASNGVRTFFPTSIPVNTSWHNYRIEVNAAGTSIEFYIDGVLVGTVTTNIPTGFARSMGYGNYIQKSIGTGTASTALVDWQYLDLRLATDRGAW